MLLEMRLTTPLSLTKPNKVKLLIAKGKEVTAKAEAKAEK